MSAFNSPWKDIDDTRPGTPYVVDSSGWGWFFVFILVAIPFLLVGAVVFQISNIICQHPILSSVIYFLISLICGNIFYKKTIRHRFCGIIATIFTMLPLGLGVGLYAIPYVMLDSSFSSVFDWVLVGLFLFGIMYFIFAICNLLKNGFIHLIISIIFVAFSLLFIFGLISSESEIITWEAIRNIYGF